MPASLVPVPLPDEGDAATTWRSEKLRDFHWRLRCLGLDSDPAFSSLLGEIAGHSQALEELAEAQTAPDYQRPWWQDGEYDAARADSANDEGTRLFRSGVASAAFDCFTEAIRLCPTSPVYHCNRAAVALKLKRWELAAEDAENALQRDGTYMRAALRAGRSRLELGQPAAAHPHFQKALQLDPACAAASRGLAEAEAALEQQQRQQAAEAAAARSGARPGLPRGAVAEESAVQQMHTAEQMLAANPRLEAAKCAHVEAQLLCQRYADAVAECSGLLPGADRQYLEAEAAWRQGDLSTAAQQLQLALEGVPSSAKCAELLHFVQQLQVLQQSAQAAMEDGVFQECIEACSGALEQLAPTACTGLYCSMLHQRAQALAARRMWAEALADLDAALAVEPAQPACLQLRAEVHRELGAYTDCFLDLQRLKRAAPGTPSLFGLVQQAARLCSSTGRGPSSSSSGACASAVPGGQAACALLGVRAAAPKAEVRRAYLQLATKWHPDKWVGGSDEERQAAEERFKEVQRAYEMLVG